MTTYSKGRSHSVAIGSVLSKPVELTFQRSVIGPELYLIDVIPLLHIFQNYGVLHHSYMDDTQINAV